MGEAADVMRVSLLAGRIMLKYGAETYRVEETMERLAMSQRIGRQKMLYPSALQHLAAGVAGGSFAILFGGVLVGTGKGVGPRRGTEDFRTY